MKWTITGVLVTGIIMAFLPAAHAADLSSMYSPCVFNMGDAQMVKDIPDLAGKCYREGIDMLQSSNRFQVVDEAEAIFSNLLRYHADLSYGWAGMAAAKLKEYEIGDDCTSCVSLQEALEDTRRAKQLKPALPDNEIVVGRIELRRYCLPCAQAGAKQAILMGATGPDVTTLRADIEAELGHKNRAETLYRAAVSAASPGSKRAAQLVTLGNYYVLQHNSRGAAYSFKQAVKQDPGDPALQLQLASFLLLEQGNPQAAEAAATKSAQIVVTIQAKRLQSLAYLLTWARSGKKASNLLWQRSFLSPEEALVTASEHRALLPLVRAILKQKLVANVDSRDSHDNTALLAACRGNNFAAVRLLLAASANPNAANDHGHTPLMLAAARGSLATFSVLLSKGAALDRLDTEGDSALSIAVLERRSQIVKLALQRLGPGQINGRWTAADLLVMAARNSDPESVRNLVDHGIPVNSRDSSGETALIAAILADSTDEVKYLLAHGADTNLAYQGQTPINLARLSGNLAIIKALASSAKSSI